jgi:hypothetical protein
MSRQHPWRAENPGAVIVDRRSKDWGNPFKVGDEAYIQAGRDGSGDYFGCSVPITRQLAVDLFRAWAQCRPAFVEAVREHLTGRDLACWCPLPVLGMPDICHAAVLLELAAS